MKTITITFDEAAYEDVLKEAIEVERDAYLEERKSFGDDTDDDDIEWNSHVLTICDDLSKQLDKLFPKH